MNLYDSRSGSVLYAMNINSVSDEHSPLWEDRIRALPPDRVKKITAYRFLDDRKRSLSALVLLEAALGRDVLFHIAEGEHGKPYIKDGPCFNISHSGEWVLLLVSEKPVGVDIERHKTRHNFREIARRAFHAVEYEELLAAPDQAKRFFDLWALKESYLKRLGCGLFTDSSSFRVLLNGSSALIETDPSAVLRL
ncbi:MAG: 4'-phosphopantetheinyl transferase superfamily protein, partial [Spirochaetaceae bacterium]|nr:4'-phosphopantetheinyl transferase superfamily protein [Spirochaetaceae bacterium]